jgi:molecular chaperone DnaK (HSP70)
MGDFREGAFNNDDRMLSCLYNKERGEKERLKSNNEFYEWINELKQTIKSARQKATATINSHVQELIWEIGKEISSKQNTWGLNIIEYVAKELNYEFPDMKGFSRRNLYAIKQWYLFYNSKY